MQVLGTPHWAPAIVWNCHKRATREGVHVIFCISITQYFCCQTRFTKERFRDQTRGFRRFWLLALGNLNFPGKLHLVCLL